MHFYYFLSSFVSILNRRQRRRTRKLYMIVTVVISCFCVFLRLLWLILVAHPGARTWCHALPWWALCCRYPRGLQAAVNKNT